METNTLKHTVSKIYLDNGNTYKVITTIKLHDECKNGTCSWSITGILQQKKGNGRYIIWILYGKRDTRTPRS